jgi:hypothetical protein
MSEVANAQPAVAAVVPAVDNVAKPAVPAATGPGHVEGNAAAGAVGKQDPELGRRASVLAAAKRKEAKVQADREALSKERSQLKTEIEEAKQHRYYSQLIKENPLRFAKEAGLDIGDLARRHIEESTGSQKTPAELAREEAKLVFEEFRAAQAKEQERVNSEQAKKRDAQIYESVRRQMGEMIGADASRYELLSDIKDEAVSRAFKLVADFHNLYSAEEDYKPLDFAKALDTVEEAEVDKAVKRAKSLKLQAKLAAVKTAETAKPVPPKPSRDVVASTVETPKASPSPQRIRRKPLDVRAMADQLVAERNAKLDN